MMTMVLGDLGPDGIHDLADIGIQFQNGAFYLRRPFTLGY
jgi:hypothetical protein